MTSLAGIVLLTFRELWAKKTVIGLFVVSTLVLLLAAFALNLDIVEGSLAGIRLFGQDATPSSGEGDAISEALNLRRIVVAVEAAVAGTAYWLGILLALFATAPLFSSMLERGHVDLLLAKPMSRPQLMFGHVLGVWAAMLLLCIYLLGGVWLIMSIKTGIWNARFLLSIALVLTMFGAIYASVVLMGAWTESTALTLIVSYGLIFVSLFLAGSDTLANQLNTTWRPVFWGLYHTLPNFAEVSATVGTLSKGEAVSSWYPYWSSMGFGAVCYGLAGWIFARKDF